MVPVLWPEVEPLGRDVALLGPELGGGQQCTQPLQHRLPIRVRSPDQNVHQLRCLRLHASELHLGTPLKVVDALPRGPVEVAPLLRSGLREVRLRGRHAGAVQRSRRQHPTQQRLRLQHVAGSLLGDHFLLLVPPHELRLEGGLPNLLQARRDDERGWILLGCAQHSQELRELGRLRLVQVPPLQRLRDTQKQSRRHAIVIRGRRQQLVHEPCWHWCVEKRGEHPDLLLGACPDKQRQRGGQRGLLQWLDARPRGGHDAALLAPAPALCEELDRVLEARAGILRQAVRLCLEVVADRGDAHRGLRRPRRLQHLHEVGVLDVLLRPLRLRH
mmetsp:Transcript_134218/g.388521  ORF Transcript_134218/g.388521 Transcript_134218/m.388521 type:complete len:330 (+) Transcript_134218:2100-3089(+)